MHGNRAPVKFRQAFWLCDWDISWQHACQALVRRQHLMLQCILTVVSYIQYLNITNLVRG